MFDVAAKGFVGRGLENSPIMALFPFLPLIEKIYPPKLDSCSIKTSLLLSVKTRAG